MTDFNLLYIDPGTGSMLFSVFISLFALLYFASRAFFIKLRVIFAGGRKEKKGETVPYVVYCEGKQYWNTFKPVVEEFERRNLPLLYLTSAEDDPINKLELKHVRTEYIGAGNKAFARLNLLEADVCLMTTPGLDVFQLKRSKGVKHYAHVLHMVNDATLYKRYGLDYFDSVLLSGDYQKEDLRYLEKLRGLPEKRLVTVGSPYLDVLAEKISAAEEQSSKEKKGFTVLVSPSWGSSGLLSCYGKKLLDPLTKSGFEIIVRPHPQSKTVEKELLDSLQAEYAGNEKIKWDFAPDNIVSLSKADIMISDFSSITLDYAFLREKPFLSVIGRFDARPYDAGKVPRELWQFRVLPDIGKELREEDFGEIKNIIEGMTEDPDAGRKRLDAKNQAWQHRGEAGRRIADFMVSVREEL